MATRGDEVEDLFEEAIALPPKDRAALLERRCKGARDLRFAVEAMLAVHDQAGSFLEKPLVAGPRLDDLCKDSDAASIEVLETEPAGSFQVGSTVAGRFLIHRFVARGGMGEVWEAWDSQVQERVALKTIRPELARQPEIMTRFRYEVKQARAISHPNVCRIHELFAIEASGQDITMFLCMEFLDGPTLSEYLRHNGPCDLDLALSLVRQLIQGLKSAHSLGIVHRDLKTKNIILVNSGPGKLRAVITDFGLAANVLTPNADVRDRKGQGTPDYMAPEQRHTGHVTVQADQYALGVVMCELLTGSRDLKHVSLHPSRAMSGVAEPDRIPSRWHETIARCVASKPEDRFHSLDDVLCALEPVRRSKRPWIIAAGCTAACALAVFLWVPHRPALAAVNLAVLPLRNETGESGLDYVGAGMTEALTNDLAQIPGLQVKAAGVVGRSFTSNVDPSEIGKRLNVASLVSGSYSTTNDHLRIPIELIEVDNGSERWGKTYEGSTSDLAELQQEISTDVAYQLKVPVSSDLNARLKRQYSTVPAAYTAYLKGRYRLNQRSPEDLRQAVSLFQSALASDSNYAPAYAGLADSYCLLAHYGSIHQSVDIKNALRAANQALALDPTLGEAYASRALARTMLNYEWKDAESDYQRAIQLNPSYLNARVWYALALLAPLGRDTEAEAQLGYVKAADPNSLLTKMSLAMVAQSAGKITQSANMLEQQLQATPNFGQAVDLLASAYLALKRPQDAIHLLQTEPVDSDERVDRAMWLSIAFAHAGDLADASKNFRRSSIEGDALNSFPYQTGLYYTSVGNYERAMDAFDLAYTKRDPDLLFVNVDPLLQPLRSTSRFHKLLSRMNLE